MTQFVESVLETILQSEPDTNGIRHVPSSSYAKVEGRSVFMHGTDDLCALIKDQRIPWLSVRVTDPHHNHSPRSLLAAAIENWEFDRHLDFDDRVLDALKCRFPTLDLCRELARNHSMPISPIFIGGGLDQRHIHLERLALIVASSREMIDTWVDLLFVEIKFRDKVFSTDFFESLSCTEKTTSLYRQLDPATGVKDRLALTPLMSVTIMAAAFDPESVSASVRRYTPASLYSLSRGTLTGYVCDSMNTIRQAFVHALYLLGPQANEGFVQAHVTKLAVKNKDACLLPSLISVMACSKNPAFSLRSLVGPASNLNESALREFCENYLFRWRDNLAGAVLDDPRNAPLKRALRKDSLVDHIFSARLFSRSYSEEQQQRHVMHFQRLPSDVQESVLGHLWHILPGKLKGSQTYGARGMAEFMLRVGDNAEAMRKLIQPRLKRMIATLESAGSGRYEFESLLKMLSKRGVLDVADFAKALPNAGFIDKLAETFKFDRDDLSKHIRPRLSADLLRLDLGL